MPTKVKIEGKKGRFVDTYSSEDFPEKNVTGIDVFTEPRAKFGAEPEGNTNIPFLMDSTGSADMNVNVGFTGTPDGVHDGTDTSLWTGSALSGTWTFNSTTHAKQGKITVIQFANLTGETITIEGTSITNTTLTEGVDFNAVTNNNTTASNIQSAVDGITGVSATVSGAVVTVTADNATTQADITTLSTNSDAGDMTATAQSIDASATGTENEALLQRGSTIDMDNFTAMTFNIYLAAWSTLKNNEIQIRARNGSNNVGSPVNISDFINTAEIGTWQSVALAKSEFGLTGETIDEFVIETFSDPGLPPDYFIDIFQVEQTGSPQVFSYEPPAGFQFTVRQTGLLFQVDGSTITVLNPNKFITLTKLSNGAVNRITKDGASLAGGTLRSNYDWLAVGGAHFTDVHGDGTDLFGKFVFDVGTDEPAGGVILRSSKKDKFEVIINDDLSSLTKFQVVILGHLHQEL